MKKSLLILLFTCWALFFAAFRPVMPFAAETAAFPDGTPVTGGRILMGTIGEPSNLIPYMASDSASGEITGLLYVAPLKYEKDLNVVPWAAASYEVVLALVQACENLGLRYHVGTGCTCASFYTGQCRTSYGGYRPSHLDADFADLRQAGVLNFEMEGATVTTLSRIFGKRAGMCASVVAQRITGEWDETAEGEYNACLAGAEAVRILTEWDRKKAEQGKRYYFPGL